MWDVELGGQTTTTTTTTQNRVHTVCTLHTDMIGCMICRWNKKHINGGYDAACPLVLLLLMLL